VHKYLEQLNGAQRDAVIETEGPSLVIAGAGSGKTRVLTYRIAYLLSKGVAPWSILALTFTNKAAREMKDRIGAIVGKEVANQLWMGTFHSVFSKILRVEAQKINFPSGFTIYDTADSRSLIKSVLKELKINEKEYKPAAVLSRISSAKNELVLPGAYGRDQNRMIADRASRMPSIHEIYHRYMAACVKAGAMDFDDLLLNTNILFRDNPDVLDKYRSKFKYILVDEYQDTNFSQYLIVRKLAELHNNVCVVGDDAQSIYSFRGAKIENILNFRNDYPNYKLFKLEQNYRSTQCIVNAANSIIANNKGQIKKIVFSEKEPGDKIQVFQAFSDSEEGFLVVNDLLKQRLANQLQFEDFAILYRTNAQSRIFEEALRKNNIPYKVYGGLSFYQRKEIKDLLAYMRMAVNPRDGEALKRIINFPTRGIGKTTLDKLEATAADQGATVWEILIHPALLSLGFNAGTLKKLNSFTGLISGLGHLVNSMNAYELTSEILSQSGILKELHQDNTQEGQTRVENLDEMINAVREFSDERMESGQENSLVHFLEEVSLLTDMDNDTPDDIKKVTLMTIHSAKGLEFKHVYVVGLEEELFPSSMALQSEHGLEEERRLFYVAVTRAEEKVTLSYAKRRFRYGEQKNVVASRFLSEMNPEYLQGFEKAFPKRSQTGQGRMDFGTQSELRQKYDFSRGQQNTTASKQGYDFRQRREVAANDDRGSSNATGTGHAGIQLGTKVEHERFGYGEVIALEGTPPNVKATVSFQNAGSKQLLLKFAKLKILN
jgi:DNA helicase II / ATP-dependent DNA helicase PcrA